MIFPGTKRKIEITYLGDVVYLGELEGDAQASEQRRHQRARAGERRDLDFCCLGVYGCLELFECLRYFPQRRLIRHCRVSLSCFSLCQSFSVKSLAFCAANVRSFAANNINAATTTQLNKFGAVWIRVEVYAPARIRNDLSFLQLYHRYVTSSHNDYYYYFFGWFSLINLLVCLV